MKRSVLVLALVLGSAQTICPHRAMAQTGTSATGQADSSVQSIDGGAGPCSVTLTATSDSKPLVAADVKVHIEYGFAGIRRLDLEAYTGNDGRVKFTGLPAKVRRPPLTRWQAPPSTSPKLNARPSTRLCWCGRRKTKTDPLVSCYLSFTVLRHLKDHCSMFDAKLP